MDLVVSGSGRLTDHATAAHLTGCGGPEPCLLDLSRASFVDPFGLVAIAAVAEYHWAERIAVDFVGPESEDCSRYMHRMGLDEILGEMSIENDLQSVRRHSTGDSLLELQRFEGVDDVAIELLAERVFRIFEHEDRAGARRLANAVLEIANNVVDHSEREGGFVALQQYRAKNSVTFAIADSGRGLRASLRESHRVSDDAHAVAMAPQRDVSSSGVLGRGRGLHSVVQQTRDGGHLRLWSGVSSGIFRNDKFEPQLRNHSTAFHGTVAQASLVLH